MPARVARIPNLECEAFYYDMERRGIVLLDMEPNAVADALEQGEIDAGPVSLLDIDRLTPQANFDHRVLRSVGKPGDFLCPDLQQTN